MQKRREFGLFRSFPNGRYSSGHPFWLLRFPLARRQICCIYSEKHQGKQIYRLLRRVTAVSPLLSCRVFAGFPEDRRRKPAESPQTHWYLCSGQWTFGGKRIKDFLITQWNSCKSAVSQSKDFLEKNSSSWCALLGILLLPLCPCADQFCP